MRHHHRRSTVLGTVLLGVVLTGALASCSNGDDSSSATIPGVAQTAGGTADETASSAAAATTAAASASSAAPTTAPAGGGGAAQPIAQLALPSDRKIIFTGSMHVETPDPEAAAQGAVRIVEGVQGFLFGQDVKRADDRVDVTVVLKIPPDAVRTTVDALSGLGKVLDSKLDASDVTDKYADLESRVTTMRTSVLRLQAFLGKATSVTDIAALEAELTRREADLESLEGQRRVLAAQAALATITLQLSQPPPAPTTAQTAEPADTRSTLERIPGFGRALERGATGLAVVGKAVALVAGLVLPFLAVALVVAAPWLVVRRRRGGLARRAPLSEPPST